MHGYKNYVNKSIKINSDSVQEYIEQYDFAYKLKDNKICPLSKKDFFKKIHQKNKFKQHILNYFGVITYCCSEDMINVLIKHLSRILKLKRNNRFEIIFSVNKLTRILDLPIYIEIYKLQKYDIFIKDKETENLKYLDGYLSELNVKTIISIVKEILYYMNIHKDLIKTNLEEGEYEMLLSPHTTAILIHELIGHYSEQDFYLENDSKIFLLESLVSKNLFKVSDLAYTNDYLPNKILYDDKGVICKNVKIISNKKFVSLMTPETGNSFITDKFSSQIRMRNFMIEDISNRKNFFTTKSFEGIYIVETGDAWCSKEGIIEIKVLEAYFISHGFITKVFSPFYIRDYSLDIMLDLVVLPSKIEWINTRCVKNNFEKNVGGAGLYAKITINTFRKSLIRRHY